MDFPWLELAILAVCAGGIALKLRGRNAPQDRAKIEDQEDSGP